MINKFRELEKIHITLLEKERFKEIESQQRGSAKTHKLHYERLVLEASNEAERYCKFNTDNSCVNVSYAGKGGYQMENVKEPNEEETMLVENIVKDHHSIMMIGTTEITMEAIEAVKKKEYSSRKKT